MYFLYWKYIFEIKSDENSIINVNCANIDFPVSILYEKTIVFLLFDYSCLINYDVYLYSQYLNVKFIYKNKCQKMLGASIQLLGRGWSFSIGQIIYFTSCLQHFFNFTLCFKNP